MKVAGGETNFVRRQRERGEMLRFTYYYILERYQYLQPAKPTGQVSVCELSHLSIEAGEMIPRKAKTKAFCKLLSPSVTLSLDFHRGT